MTEHNEPTRNESLKEDARLTANLRLGDPRGLHCRVSALLAHRLRVEATGDDAAKAMEIVRSLVEREPLSREEVVRAIPEGESDEIGEIRARQQRLIQEEQDKADYDRWISPGGWLYQLIGPEQLGYGPDEYEGEEV